MPTKILNDMTMPILAGPNTEAELENATRALAAFLGQLFIASDTGLLFMAVADTGPIKPVVERWRASLSTDTAPNDDTTAKKITLQKRTIPPTNAAYIAFMNNPGTDVFYLVLEEAE